MRKKINFQNIASENIFLSSFISWNTSTYWVEPINIIGTTNKKIYEVILELISKWKTTSLLDIKTEFISKWEDIDNQVLTDIASCYWDKEHAAEAIKRNYQKVQAYKVAEALQKEIENWDQVVDLLPTFASKLIDVSASSLSKKSNLEDDLEMFYKQISSNYWKKLLWYSSWLEFLDIHTRWFQKGRQYRIGAPSNTGKTTLAYNIIPSLLEQWAKVWFFTLEVDKSDTIWKLLSVMQRESFDSIMSWEVTPDFDLLTKYKDKLFIIDNIFDLSKIFTNIVENQYDVVLLDYIWLVKIHWIRRDELFEEYANEVPRFLKFNKTCWIDFSNLPKNEDWEFTKINWGFNWSASLKNNTSVGIHMFPNKKFIEYKRANYKDPRFHKKTIVELIITKNRFWANMVEELYEIDFLDWWVLKEASQEVKDLFWALEF